MSTAPQTSQNHLQIDHFAKDCQDIIRQAQDRADELKSPQILSLHLFAAAMKNESVLKTFKALSLSEKDLVSKIEMALDQIPPNEKDEEAYFSREADRLLMALGKDSSSSDLVHIERLFGSLIAKGQKPNAALFQEVCTDGKMFCEKLKEVRGTRFGQLSKAQLLNMEKELGKRVIGQKEAISAVSRVVRRSFAGLNEPNRPLTNLLMLGPSGVGKTELAKALAQFLYGDEKKLLRIDCSELKQSHQAIRLTGSPSSYVGSEDGGQLTNFVMKEPNSIILFDEVEKSHPSVFDLLLQVFDAGILSDGRGKQVDFSGTIILLTSNIGGRDIIDHNLQHRDSENAESREQLREMLLSKLMGFLRPELIGRLDQTIVFESLSHMEIGQVVEIQLRALQTILKKQEMTITFEKEAKDAIAELGFDPLFGARPLKKIITKHIRDPLAEAIIADRYQSGSRIVVSFDNDQFRLN